MTTETKSTENSSEVQIKKILVPIDGSEYSLKAAKYAIKIAKDENAQLLCIHIITPRIPYGYSSSIPTTDKSHTEIKDKVQNLFDIVRQIAKNAGLSDMKTDVFVDVKSVSESILNYSANEDIDLIVIGTKGRTGLKRFLIGSVANAVIQHVHCPILLVR
ncbi:universal stress protein [Nitrososphaera sp. AFS]|uniref:universal stress protein n=1 Tax=Nitrososphaera sp. AFS TaxID=2301191 RepID=UPI00139249CD|nr:universal stress protein [Nitrososphaera sp. AFS]NAL78840.1 universal stress protein [Nitrososphaera sp. AFS]